MKVKTKVKQKYSVFQNIHFVFSNIWKVDKFYFLAFIPQIPLSVFLPLAGVYFPKLLIELIGQKAGDIHMLVTIGAYCLVLMAAGIIKLFCQTRISSTRYVFMLHFQKMVSVKNLTTDYENTENPKVSDMKDNSYGGSAAGDEIANELNSLLINILGIFTYGGIIGVLNPLILLLLLVSGAINYLTLTHVRNFTEKNRNTWMKIERKIVYLQIISSQYDHAKDIKLYGMRSWLLGLMIQYQKQRMKWHLRVYNKNLFSGVVDGGLRFVRDGAAYAVLISMLLANKLDVGSFVFYFGAITGFSTWLSSVIGQFHTIINQSIDINLLRVYLDVEDRFNHAEGIQLPTKDEIPYEIELCDLTYRYPGNDTPAIDGVNLKINKGEKLAVVGRNGAGKTTLVKLLCGLYYPSSGSVLLSGKDAKEYNIDDYYTQFATVFQDINLIAVPICQFVAGSCENVDKEKAWQKLTLAGLDKVVQRLENGIDTTLIKGVFDDGVDLSGGEQQKLVLARALYKDAPVIVLDEPTAALDPIAENEMYMKYAELTEGKTSVYISHRLSSTRFCDRIIFLQDGKIAECGSHDELMKKDGLYANMFNIQSRYYKEDCL